jgi:ribosome biogenesis GTPase A
MLRRYRDQVMDRYRLTELPEDAHDLLQQVGRRLGCLMAGGGVDLQRASEAFLRELRAGKLGRVSLEEPEPAPGSVEETEAEGEAEAGVP